MKGLRVAIIFLWILTTASCATVNNYDAIGTSLTEMDQKVAGHYYSTEIPDNFDIRMYKQVLTDVCKNNPMCQDKATKIFNDFHPRARKLEDVNIFTVMLCDKDSGNKLMEAFSCNNMEVTVQTYKLEIKEPCDFVMDWQKVIKDKCPEWGNNETAGHK